jgi:hypothetical protein
LPCRWQVESLVSYSNPLALSSTPWLGASHVRLPLYCTQLSIVSCYSLRAHCIGSDIRLYFVSTMASSSDTRSTCVWLEDMHIALRRPRLAQANNERITFVSALNQRNKRGYDVLLFRPPVAIGKRAKAVTLYEGNWHELEHDSITKQPYLGVE